MQVHHLISLGGWNDVIFIYQLAKPDPTDDNTSRSWLGPSHHVIAHYHMHVPSLCVNKKALHGKGHARTDLKIAKRKPPGGDTGRSWVGPLNHVIAHCHVLLLCVKKRLYTDMPCKHIFQQPSAMRHVKTLAGHRDGLSNLNRLRCLTRELHGDYGSRNRPPGEVAQRVPHMLTI